MSSRNFEELSEALYLSVESIAEAIESQSYRRFLEQEADNKPSETVVSNIRNRVQKEQEWSSGALKQFEQLLREREAKKESYIKSLTNLKDESPKPATPSMRSPISTDTDVIPITPFEEPKEEEKPQTINNIQVIISPETVQGSGVSSGIPQPVENLPSTLPQPVEKPVEKVVEKQVKETAHVSQKTDDDSDDNFELDVEPAKMSARERRRWEKQQKIEAKKEAVRKAKEAREAATREKAEAKKKKASGGGIFRKKNTETDDLAKITDEDMRTDSSEEEEKQPIEITTGADTAGATKDLERHFKEEDLLFKRDRTKSINHQTWFEEAMANAVIMGASDFLVNTENYDAENVEDTILQCRVRIDGEMRDYDFMRGTIVRQVMGVMQATAGFESGRANKGEETIIDVLIDGEKRKGRAAMEPNVAGGQTLVIRLPLTGELKQLHELKFAPYNLELIYKLLAMPGKLVMLAGPMGSGKTTTAHGALLHVNTPGRTVWTIEDPVERRLPNIYQMEVNNADGVAHSFGDILRLTLRLDYNTLFLGEIRDTVTASAAVMQAKVGRQIISTIHADNNILALQRLIELSGDTPLGALSAAGGVISQRLVRMINPNWDGKDPSTKYKGRVPIHEILIVNDNLIEVMASGASQSEIRNAVSECDHSTFVQDAYRLMKDGISDREELEKTLGLFPKAEWED